MINKVKTTTKEIDEYGIFNQTLMKINSYNNNTIPLWATQLDDFQKGLWNELIHTRRIVVNYSGIKLDVPRRTLKIKRNVEGENSTSNTNMSNQINVTSHNNQMNTNSGDN
jgi:hypothetical protein